ncbi:phage structural protein [Indiicoccus explosivorum]|uniref:phage structural protein n=1 Tax=Indiicoccus explosivorum TaxID=1917864 RepID=UPI000B44E1D3|nr:DUF3277 domain-containing protein [Indiicoccus explosivorum]
MPVGVYDSSKVIVTVDNMHITGLADGTFISFEAAEDGFSYSVGAAPGDVVVSETNDETRTATLVLQQTSPYVSYLDNIAKSKRLVPVYCMNTNEPKEKSGGTMCRIQRPAARSYGKEAANREYSIVVFDYTEE